MKNEINEIIKEYETNSYLKKNEFPDKFRTPIGQIISFGQNNINKLSTLKESNIDAFKEIFLNQINYINSTIQEDLKKIYLK